MGLSIKSGAEMMDILVDDIMRYESLVEMDEMISLDTLIHGDKVENPGSVVKLVLVTPISIYLPFAGVSPNGTQVSDTESNKRYKPVILEDTDKCLMDNRNKNTTYKSNSDLRMFYDLCRSNRELRLIEDVPAEQLDTSLSRFYIGIS